MSESVSNIIDSAVKYIVNCGIWFVICRLATISPDCEHAGYWLLTLV